MMCTVNPFRVLAPVVTGAFNEKSAGHLRAYHRSGY
jgi:hypothetical protein